MRCEPAEGLSNNGKAARRDCVIFPIQTTLERQHEPLSADPVQPGVTWYGKKQSYLAGMDHSAGFTTVIQYSSHLSCCAQGFPKCTVLIHRNGRGAMQHTTCKVRHSIVPRKRQRLIFFKSFFFLFSIQNF